MSKRVKQVFTNSYDVIHRFVNQTQDYAKCSNVFFEKDKIYSYGYHYLMGVFKTTPLGVKVLFVNDYRYSSNTGKHLNQLWHASSHLTRFTLTNIEYCDAPNIIVKEFKEKFKNELQSYKNSNKEQTAKSYLNNCKYLRLQIEKYLSWFNLELTELDKIAFSVPSELIEQKAKQFKKQRAARIEKNKELVERYDNLINNNRIDWLGLYRVKNFLDPETLKKANKIAETYTTTIKQYYNNIKNEYVGYYYNDVEMLLKEFDKDADDKTYLSFNDKFEVTTSKGIKLPLNVAFRYYILWYKYKDAEAFPENLKVLEFQVKAINNNWFVIGCHNIHKSCIEYIANKMNWGVPTAEILELNNNEIKEVLQGKEPIQLPNFEEEISYFTNLINNFEA